MLEQKQFLCCASKQIAILRCPRCSHLLGFCQSCSTLFSNLKDLSASLALPGNTAINCTNCQFTYPANDWQKHLAAQRDLGEAGIRLVLSDEIQLKSGPREEAVTENYRHMMDRIGWDGKITTRSAPTTMAQQSGTSLGVKLLAFLLIGGMLGGGGWFFWDFFFPPPPPPKPPKAGKGAKPTPKPPAPPVKR